MKSLLSLLFLTVTVVGGNLQPFGKRNIPLPPPEEGDFSPAHARAAITNLTGTAFFDQLLDHNDPSKGTFKQQYWWNATTWAGSGSPVVFFTPGEIAAAPYTGYLTNRTITGVFAQELKGAVVMLEHRYYGSSSPYESLTVENLQLLTVDQALKDNLYFAKNVKFAFDTNHSSNAQNAPWVFSGGSYSGVLAAFTESIYPGTFWAYHASSAPVEAIHDFWQYFVPVQAGMPKNCSKDVTLVIDHVDSVLKKGTPAEKLALKELFGLTSVEHDGDFGNALQSGPWGWQSTGPTTGYSAFYQFCDSVENVTAGAAVIPNENGVGLATALEGYANWIRPADNGKDVCTYYGYEEYDFGCYNSYDPKNVFYTDISVDNVANRQWMWILCNEPFGFWQDGAPRSRDTIVSRFVSDEFWQRQCDLYFPTEKGIYTYRSKLDPNENVHKVNKWSKGWRLEDTTRLIWTNGEYDPWVTASISSKFRPGGPLASTPQHPVNFIPKGIHCNDLIIRNAVADPGTQKAVDIEVKQIVDWVAEYYQK
ncbi:serine carboxypeptidase S28-domain-containing protein [Bisporella sp. PMI_857]|nr:serine carboxypeptidase S28-domain-containing protein [Bisporella sp. PMI_857]